ncbi:MAG TPA: hypothetical protein VMT03_16615, partial [Polyangia bacterium]|nr:hypothetical protein [Polyangia bacterium]
AGVRPARLGMLSFHLLISGLGAVVSRLTGRALARRARRQRREAVPWDVRLRRPSWIELEMSGMLLWGAGLLAALPAAAGLSSVSVGVLLTLVVMVEVPLLSDAFMSPVDLTFQVGGLRMHLGAVSFQVPWELITRVEPVGPDHHRVFNLHLADRAALIASTTPPTASARARVERLLSMRRGSGVSLLVPLWTAGVDGLVLERAIEAGRRQESRRGGALN